MTYNFYLSFLISVLMFAAFFVVGEVFLPHYIKKFRAYFAPIAGYAVYTYIFFVLFYLTTNFWIVWLINSILLGACLCVFVKRKKYPLKIFFISLCFSLVISIYIADILSIKYEAQTPFLYQQMFDHMKVTITASISRDGLPLQNPYCAFPTQLSYFFLHFIPSAAISIAFKVNAYTAEIINLIITILTGISVMFGTLNVLKQKECSCKELIVCTLFIITGPLNIFIPFLSGTHGFDSILTTLTWTAHNFLATCYLLLVAVIIYQNKLKYIFFPAFLLAVLAGTSIYIAIVAALGLGIYLILDLFQKPSREYLSNLILLCLLGFILSFPFILNQSNVMQYHQFPITVHIYPWSTLKNPLFQIIGFFTVYYFLQSPLIFGINLIYLRLKYLKQYAVFYFLIFASVFITCFLKTTIVNNDLGWRAILVSIVIFTIFASYYFSFVKIKILRYGLLIVALACSSSSLELSSARNKSPIRSLSKESLQAIEQHVNPQEYFLNNVVIPNARDIVKIGNLDFVIWSNRRSCYASHLAVQASCDISLRSYKDSVTSIFDGDISPRDIEAARKINCNKFIFHYTDANFNKDKELKAAGLYKIYENTQIKIYE